MYIIFIHLKVYEKGTEAFFVKFVEFRILTL